MPASSERHNPSDSSPSEATAAPFLLKFLTTGFYSGYSPIAPGTAGTLVGLAAYLIPSFERAIIIGPAIVLGFLLGVFGGTKLEQTMGHDPTIVVIDEMVGMWISLFLLPKTFTIVAIAFLIFRALDVIKPPPARLFDRKVGGFAIMMDDVVAGVYTNLIVHAGIFLFQAR